VNSTDLYEAFRSDVSDEAAPYLWADAEVFRYMNDAYRMFVRKTGGVADFTSAATQIPVVAGDPVGALDPSVLRVMNAYLVSNNTPLTILNGPGAAPPTSRAGQVRAMVIGEQRHAVRWTAIPAADDTVQLSVYRLPLRFITGDAQAFTDVDEDHHIHLLDWMKHLAYRKQDAEAFDRAKSDECGAAFIDYCDFVKAEHERYKHKTRVVAYGGI
jgi:hypothetical protein